MELMTFDGVHNDVKLKSRKYLIRRAELMSWRKNFKVEINQQEVNNKKSFQTIKKVKMNNNFTTTLLNNVYQI